MRRVRIRSAGGYDRLELEEVPDPAPGPGEVRVATAAAGVNFADCAVRMGLYASARQFVGWPITPGFEFAGTVAALGAGVEAPSLGAPVFGVTRFDGYASQVVAPTRQVFPLPSGWSPEQAAGFPAVFLTAWVALERLGRVQPGERVLVHSAAGGVGGAVLQLCGALGARAVGVVSGAHKVAPALALGAEAVIDKTRQDLWREAERLAPEGYDLVLDANGVETLAASYEHLRPLGRLVVYGFATMLRRGTRSGRVPWPRLAWTWLRTPRFDPLAMTEQNRSVMALNLSFLFDRTELLAEGMARLLGWVADGRLRPLAVTPYPLAEAARAQQDLESGRTVGKLVLVP